MRRYRNSEYKFILFICATLNDEMRDMIEKIKIRFYLEDFNGKANERMLDYFGNPFEIPNPDIVGRP